MSEIISVLDTDAASRQRTRRIRRVVAVTVVGATLGVTGALAVASARSASDDPPAPGGCRATQSDLETAAEAARRLELQAPWVFQRSPRPADEWDLRLAAEWAYRLSILSPEDCRHDARTVGGSSRP